MTYREAWTFLDQLQFFKIKLGLESMTRFLAALDNPHLGVPCIHVGGTNGKGSVAATLLAILTQAGYKVGLYTSPHLSSVRERFRIGRDYISQADFAAEASRIRDVLGENQITYFEFTTTLAMLWFARQQVDLAILEVGMGGRLDATNVVTPLVSVITNVSMDHEQYLGTTLKEIATEKAGIIKPGIPVVSAVADDDSRKVIRETCADQKSRLFLFGRDFAAHPTPEDGKRWDYYGLSGDPEFPQLHSLPLALSGSYQLDNAAVSLAALELLAPHNFTISEMDIRRGLQQVQWPGRMEELWRDSQGVMRTEPPAVISGATKHFLLDGAHNPAGVHALREALLLAFPRQQLILIWAAMADKNLDATLPLMASLADIIILTRPQSERSATPQQLKEILPLPLRRHCHCFDSVADAIHYAIDQADAKDLICIAGSLYLVGKARQLLLGDLAADDE